MMNSSNSHWFEGGLPFPLHSWWRSIWDSKPLGGNWTTRVEHWRDGANKLLLTGFWFFHQNLFLKNAYHPCQHALSPALSETLFWAVSLFSFWWRQWPGDTKWFYCGCRFFILWDILARPWSCSLAFPIFLPPLLSLHAPPHTSKKPREIDKQQDRGNWAILFLLREPHFAAFIWKLSFSTSLGKSSHRPVTPKCLC